MPVVLLRPSARDDITEIWGYIADDSELEADAFVDRLDAKFRAKSQLIEPSSTVFSCVSNRYSNLNESVGS